MRASILPGLLSVALLTSAASAAEFDAAIGKTGFGRCHMDGCSFFIIDAAVPVGAGKDGTLFAISARVWSAEYRMHGDNDTHEYDRPPVSVGEKTPELSMVFCSKVRPVSFYYGEGKWHSADLRPGDESAVFGYNESAYQFYYAACHHFITRDPVSKAMATRLGYQFAKHPSEENVADSDDKRQPMDMLR